MSQGRTKRPSLSDRAYEQLFQMILRCELEPGAWVTVAALRELLHTGHTPIHQALLRLEADGFATPLKRKGWQITPLTLKTASEIFEAFRLTGPALATLVARNATEEEILRLRELTVAWAPGVPGVDGPNFESAPFAYFAEICGNPMMTRTASGLLAHFERVMNFALRQGSFSDDEEYVRWRDATLDALGAGDEDEARRSLSGLIAVGESEVLRILQGTDSLLSLPLPMTRNSAS